MLWKTLFQWWSHSAPYLITVRRDRRRERDPRRSIRPFDQPTPQAEEGHPRLRDPRNSQLRRRLLRRSGQAASWNLIFMVIGLALIIPAIGHPPDLAPTVRGGNYQSTAPSAVRDRLRRLLRASRSSSTSRFSLPALSQWIYGSQAGYAVLAQQGLGQRPPSAVSPRCSTGSRR